MNLTIAQLLQAVEKEIFSVNSTDFFQTQCREREIQIKRFIDILWKTIHDHIDTPGLNQGKIGHWKKAKIQNNLNNLITYLEELAYELDKEKIEIFIRNRELSLLSKIVFMPDLILLTINSYYGSIITDIYWIDSITVHEAVLIGKGKLELSTLSKYVNSKVSSTKELINSHKSIFKQYDIKAIEEIIICHQKKLYKAFNSLTIHTIEGLARKLGTFLIVWQNLPSDTCDGDYNSLDSFLRNIPWKNDLEIRISKYILLTGDYNRSDKEIVNDQPVLPRTKLVSLKYRLDFLRRRFRENRNIIAHGDSSEYSQELQAFINASAILEVMGAIIEYHQLYK